MTERVEAVSDAPVQAPSREDRLARAASHVAGGPAGERVGTGSHGFWWAGPVVLLGGTVAMLLAVLLRQHCRVTLWSTPDQFTHACYSDVPTLFGASGLVQGLVPYRDAGPTGYLEQPVGTGAILWLLGALAPGGPDASRWVFDLGVLLLTLALMATVWAVLQLSGRRPWDAALVAFSPVVLTASLVSLDLVAIALTVLGVLAFSRRHPVQAGLLVGAATAVRPLAVLVVVALVLLALRTGRWGSVGRVALAAAAAWLALNLPVALAATDGWRAYWVSAWHAPVGHGSLWRLPQLAATEPAVGSLGLGRLVHLLLGHPLPPDALRWVSAAGVVLVVAAVAVFVLSSRRRPRLPVVVLALVVGVLLVLPAVPVQAALWVLPFAALAVPRWRVLLVWGAVEAAYATVTWLHLYADTEASRGAPAWLYGTLLMVRLVAMAWLVQQAVALSRNPRRDPVRAPADAQVQGRDDPAAGDLEGAHDALVVRFS